MKHPWNSSIQLIEAVSRSVRRLSREYLGKMRTSTSLIDHIIAPLLNYTFNTIQITPTLFSTNQCLFIYPSILFHVECNTLSFDSMIGQSNHTNYLDNFRTQGNILDTNTLCINAIQSRTRCAHYMRYSDVLHKQAILYESNAKS